MSFIGGAIHLFFGVKSGVFLKKDDFILDILLYFL